ncbi:MAG TPA: sialidase family protein [Thermoanaerobaculia bacterium]|nr:sialidase family protein [Thermoanaerobaculia bacterium]
MARTIVVAILVVAALPAAFRAARQTRRAAFQVPPAVKITGTPEMTAHFLPPTRTHFVHGASIAELPDGDLLAAWYGGSDEVRADVNIYCSRQDHRTGGWSVPRILETRQGSEDAMRIRVKSIGNPVLFADGRGVALFYVAVLYGGWSGGTICMKTSADGERWALPKRIVTSPFLNVGMLVRSKPWRYDDGSIVLPVYHELLRKWSALVRIDARGRVVDERRVSDGRPLVQPWLIPTGEQSAVTLLRWSSRMPGSVTVTRSGDGGRRWTDVFGTRLVQRDSAVAGIRLADGSLLAAYNNSAWDRRDLSLARSADDGLHWSKPSPVERDTTPDNMVRREYSYPYFLQTRDGRYHLVYTWQRKLIRHVVFNDAWVLDDPLLANPRG